MAAKNWNKEKRNEHCVSVPYKSYYLYSFIVLINLKSD